MKICMYNFSLFGDCKSFAFVECIKKLNRIKLVSNWMSLLLVDKILSKELIIDWKIIIFRISENQILLSLLKFD